MDEDPAGSWAGKCRSLFEACFVELNGCHPSALSTSSGATHRPIPFAAPMTTKTLSQMF
jgi:hypothetical protein